MAISAPLDLTHLLVATEALSVVSGVQSRSVLGRIARFLVTGSTWRWARTYGTLVVAARAKRLRAPVEPACKLALTHRLIEMHHDLLVGKLDWLVVLGQHIDDHLVRKII